MSGVSALVVIVQWEMEDLLFSLVRKKKCASCNIQWRERRFSIRILINGFLLFIDRLFSINAA